MAKPPRRLLLVDKMCPTYSVVTLRLMQVQIKEVDQRLGFDTEKVRRYLRDTVCFPVRVSPGLRLSKD